MSISKMKPSVVFGLLTAKNILSFGSGGFEIDLSSHSLTLVEGANGHGKSTILEALTYCLFGKPYRKVKLAQLINSVNNKALLTTLEFSCGVDNYKILRGQKPGIFEIWKNGELIPEDSCSGDYQKFLEKKILGFSYKTFKQVCVIGSASYTQFMTLNAEQRRGLIEDLLDVNVYSRMAVYAKEELGLLKKEVDAINSSTEQKKSELVRLEKILDDMKASEERKKSSLASEIAEAQKSRTAKESEAEALQKQVDGLLDSVSEYEALKNSAAAMSQKMTSFGSDLKKLESSISFYDDNDVCPTCTQDIQSSHKESIKSSLHAEVKAVKADAFEVFNDLKSTKAKVTEMSLVMEEIAQKNKLISECNRDIARLNSTVDVLQREAGAVNDSSKVSDQIDVVRKEVESLLEKKVIKQEDFSYLQESCNMLKDSGIKACTVKEYIPLINSSLNEHLEQFGLFVDFQLDENFDEKILSRHRDDFSYFSFSEGEKQRIDLSILFTWREISRRKNSVSCNILFFDETLDSSLDQDSIAAFLTMLRDKDDSNVFVISHRGADPMYFDRVIRATKKGDGFSRLKEE